MTTSLLAYDGDGGVAVDVANLARGLPEAGIETLTVPTARAAIAALARHPAAILHVFGCLPTSQVFRVLPAARAGRRPLVWTPVFHPSRPGTWRGYGLLRAMELFDRWAPRVARFVDAVIAATDAEAAFFAELGARHVVVIPPGVPDVIARRAKPPAAEPVVLVVARDNRRKGLRFALEAFARLRELAPAAQLLLVGPPRDHPAASRPGVRCPGWLGAEEVERAYQAADLLFVPSLYEGLPRVVIEAWRTGLPVMATDRVALAPAIAGAGGEIVRYGDADSAARAMSHLLNDSAALTRYGAGGRRLVEERFLLPRLMRQTAALYTQLRATRA